MDLREPGVSELAWVYPRYPQTRGSGRRCVVKNLRSDVEVPTRLLQVFAQIHTDQEWVVQIRDRCLRRGVPFFFKQWGGVNKKRTGRELDGATWDEMPTTAVERELIHA